MKSRSDAQPTDAQPTDSKRSEHVEQREFVSWFRQTYPLVRIFAIPNGGKRGQREALRLKVEGVSPGVPDLYIPAWKFWIEMKVKETGRVTKEQEEWHEYLLGIGDRVAVCWSCEEAKQAVLDIAPLRG